MGEIPWGFKSPLRHEKIGAKAQVRGGAVASLRWPGRPFVRDLSAGFRRLSLHVARAPWFGTRSLSNCGRRPSRSGLTAALPPGRRSSRFAGSGDTNPSPQCRSNRGRRAARSGRPRCQRRKARRLGRGATHPEGVGARGSSCPRPAHRPRCWNGSSRVPALSCWDEATSSSAPRAVDMSRAREVALHQSASVELRHPAGHVGRGQTRVRRRRTRHRGRAKLARH